MTREEALTVATMLVEAYPREIQAGTLKAYALHLTDLDRTVAVAAIRRLVATSKWLPAISEIRQAVARQTLPVAPDAAVAWDAAVTLMRRYGSYGTLGAAGNPYVNRTLRLCGAWEDICHEDVTWLRKRFVEIYATVVQQAEVALQIGQDRPDWLALQAPAAKQLASGV